MSVLRRSGLHHRPVLVPRWVPQRGTRRQPGGGPAPILPGWCPAHNRRLLGRAWRDGVVGRRGNASLAASLVSTRRGRFGNKMDGIAQPGVCDVNRLISLLTLSPPHPLIFNLCQNESAYFLMLFLSGEQLNKLSAGKPTPQKANGRR